MELPLLKHCWSFLSQSQIRTCSAVKSNPKLEIQSRKVESKSQVPGPHLGTRSDRHLPRVSILNTETLNSIAQWNVAATSNVPAILSQMVIEVLFDITPNSSEARNGSYFGWQHHLGNAPVIDMLQRLGIMTRNESGVWRCTGTAKTDLYDSIVCPEGSFVKTRSGVEAGCSVFGLNCTINGKEYSECMCRPCIFRDEVEIFNSGFVELSPSNIEANRRFIKKDVIDHDRREQMDRGTQQVSFEDALSEMAGSAAPPAPVAGDLSPSSELPDGDEQLQDVSDSTSTKGNADPSSQGKKMDKMETQYFEAIPPLLCSKFKACNPGVQQRALSPFLIKDHLMRRPGSADFR